MNDDELVQSIRDAALEVYTVLGPGYIEAIYEEAMAIELRLRGIQYEIERTTEVFYKDAKVGTHRLDFVVENRVVVELKAGQSITKGQKAQIDAYMKTLGIQLGLLINFPYPESPKGPQMESLPGS